MGRTIWILLAAVLVLGACGDDDEPVAAGDGGAGFELAGEYLSTEVTEAGEPRPLVEGTRISLRFDDGQLQANAGCNHLAGEYRWEGDVLEVGSMGGTEMGCDPPRHDQDEWLMGVLTSSPTLAPTDDGFTLRTGTTTIGFVDEDVAVPDAELVGTRWVVTGFVDGETAMSTTAGTAEAFLELRDDGFVVGHDGCNHVGWSQDGDDEASRRGLAYEVGDGTITFEGDAVQTLIGCPEETAERFHAVLSGTVSYELDGRSLTLLADDGRGVTYTAAD